MNHDTRDDQSAAVGYSTTTTTTRSLDYTPELAHDPPKLTADDALSLLHVEMLVPFLDPLVLDTIVSFGTGSGSHGSCAYGTRGRPGRRRGSGSITSSLGYTEVGRIVGVAVVIEPDGFTVGPRHLFDRYRLDNDGLLLDDGGLLLNDGLLMDDRLGVVRGGFDGDGLTGRDGGVRSHGRQVMMLSISRATQCGCAEFDRHVVKWSDDPKDLWLRRSVGGKARDFEQRGSRARGDRVAVLERNIIVGLFCL